MINLRAGLNRYLQNPPNNRIINLMKNDTFQNANKVFTGQLRANKQAGHDTSKPKSAILQQDLEKLYTEYFTPGLAASNVQILQEKVFFDLLYYTGRRGKEGLRALNKNSFAVKVTPEGKEYLVATTNEVTKKNQGDESSTAYAHLHNNPAIILEQEDSYRCPVNSYKHYIESLNPKLNDLFQRPNKSKNGFDAMPLGKNQLGTMMKKISEAAGLSIIYTNHEIRSTTATAMHKQKFGLKDIQNVTKHKNIQSLERYVGGPTLDEKESYSNALYDYTKSNKKRPLAISNEKTPSPKKQKIEEPTPESSNNALAVQENDENVPAPSGINNNIVQNQLKQAPVLFGGATFQNCNITLNVPK